MRKLKNKKRKNMDLKEGFTISKLQEYIKETKRDRGFNYGPQEAFSRFVGEVGEVAEEMTKFQRSQESSREFNPDNVAHELVDCFIYLIELANQFGIDLEKSFLRKENINNQRSWEV